MHPISAYSVVEVSHPYRLVGPGNNQSATDLGLIWQPPSYRASSRVQGAASVANATLRVPGFALGGYSIQNRSGSTGVVGLGVRIPNTLWRAGQWTEATTTYTDDTTDAQDVGAADFALETTTDNDGHIVFSQVPFNAISYDIGTASVAGLGMAHDLAYSDEEGDGWVTLTNPFINSFGTVAVPLTGTTIANEALVVFDVPSRWGRTTPAGAATLATSALVGYYGFRVRATDAPDTAAVADSLSLYRLYFLREGVADNGVVESDFGAKDFVMAWDHLPGAISGELYGDALVALFETADPGNRVYMTVRGR